MKRKKEWKERFKGVRSITEAHLKKLGAESFEQVKEWEKKGKEDTYWISGVKQFCDILWKSRNRVIYIIGDYDVDGICATAILYLALTWLRFFVKYIIPRRFSQGYGMKKEMIDQITEENVLIITVDNGIAAADVVAYAKEKGHTIIVTDHHEPVKTDEEIRIPNSDLVIDPKIMPGLADFDGYCGAGIAYKLARALLKDLKGMHIYLLPLAALGTVCDQMPLTEENFYFVKAGLQILNYYNGEGGRPNYVLPGIRALAQVLNIPVWNITKMGFHAGPTINSGERTKDGKAGDVVRMLTSGSTYDAMATAEELKELNDLRKKMVADAVEKIIRDAELDENGCPRCPIIKYVPSISEGIIGIIASKLVDYYALPAAVFTESAKDPEMLKGSFRTVEGFSIIDLLRKCDGALAGYGGHAGAAGAAVEKNRFAAMKKALQDEAEGFGAADTDTRYYDYEIDNSSITSAIEENERFAPSDLVFKIVNFVPEQRYGEWKRELKGNGVKFWSRYSEAVGFNLENVPDVDTVASLTLYGSITMNTYNGKSTPQIIVTDIEACG